MRKAFVAVLMVVPQVLLAQFPPAELTQRRGALLATLSDGFVLVLGAPEPEHDYLEFDQTPAMRYLTGILEPNAALLLTKSGTKQSGSVFVLPRNPNVEVWSGARIGPEGATRISGLPARDRAELTRVVDSLASAGGRMYVVGTFSGDSLAVSPDQQYLDALKRRYPALQVQIANGALERLRGKKSPAELELLRKTVDITVAAHAEALKAIRPGMHEYEIEAVIESVFRRNGADRPSFASIIGSGPNATTLHYNVNDRQVQPGDVVLMDIGSSYKGYAADVTRTVPADGTYSPEQRRVYQIVRDAQAAAERNAKPGMPAAAMNDSATAVIAAGLTRLGLIEGANATFDFALPNGSTRSMPQHFLYYMHGLGHGIGLEVHDPEQFYFSGTIGEGSAFTIEPGIYVRPDLLDVLADTPKNRALIDRIRPAFQQYRGIGVRIEDDYIVTGKGLEWISRAPREMDEIEAIMKRRIVP